MKSLADLIIALGSEAVKRYEHHTGLNGIGDVINPLVHENAQRYAGSVQLNPNGMQLGLKAFGILSEHWGRLQGQQQPEQEVAPPVAPPTLVMNTPPVKPVANHMVGIPVAGFVGRQGVRTGRR